MEKMIPPYMRYWGKAKREPDTEGADYHLLPYHCLDVAAVAECWWQQSRGIRTAFAARLGIEETQAKAWVLFFIALHDYGKWDLRFQRKAPNALQRLNPGLLGDHLPLSDREVKNYFHGPQGLGWFQQDFSERFIGSDDWLDDSEAQDEAWQRWLPWMAAVAGHHGHIPNIVDEVALPRQCNAVAAVFKQVRIAWVEALEALFLTPVGLSFEDNPPLLANESDILLAGFCSVSDWLGSSDAFPYDAIAQDSLASLREWYDTRQVLATSALQSAGLITRVQPAPSIERLLGGYSPRQIQTRIDELPLVQGLTLIEASTGSGKTEAALSYAWRLLDAGLADSIVFALPTQATANAMYSRLEKAADIIFADESNLILAHGRAEFNEGFSQLKLNHQPDTAQGEDEAWVHCSEWLAQSRKRVFLGQIGVCTVDQVLVSVLPIRHKFVRGFGIGRSVLIVDEVHAYDSYMYGLLGGVLAQQKACGGSAILLSATLPAHQKSALAEAWQVQSVEQSDHYPLISCFNDLGTSLFDLESRPEQLPTSFSVDIDLHVSDDLLPNQHLIARIQQAVVQGAQVCVICNLVDVAQNLYQQFFALFDDDKNLSADQLALFHSRFSFHDRQQKEHQVINTFGKHPKPTDVRSTGHLLIATQVVEQSLDLDFDWMITQLCPVDLLFQRMGRLHRHARTRPAGFEYARCSVLVPSAPHYQLHELIYGNSRVLWRTQQLLETSVEAGCGVEFPSAYRAWIEPVYQETSWPQEPDEIQQNYSKFIDEAFSAQCTAKQLMASSMNPLADDDANVSVLTRDGEMSLSVVPYVIDPQGAFCLLDGERLPEKSDITRREVINLNTVPVPKSWCQHGKALPEPDEDGLIWLQMEENDKRFQIDMAGWRYDYCHETGFQRKAQSD